MSYKPPVGILVAPPGHGDIQKGDGIGVVFPETPDELDLDVLSADISGPALAPCGYLRVRDPESDVTLQAVLKSYLSPELQQRLQSDETEGDVLPIRQALIVLPPAGRSDGPTILLNDEVEVTGAAGLKYGGANRGDPLTLDRIYHFESLELPRVREEDGFIWIRFDRGQYTIYFDLLPCNTELEVPEEIEEVLDDILQAGVADGFFQGIFGDPFESSEDLTTRMRKDGWFPCPALLPEPWNAMRAAFDEGATERVEELAVEAISEERLRLMLKNWENNEPFASDYPFFERGVRHYIKGDYISSVSVILPRLEGLINRARLQQGLDAKRKLAEAFGAVESAAKGSARDRWIGRQIREHFEDFLDEFLVATFDPNESNALMRLGRHAHTHGATAADRYTQSYALQVILALDALYFVLIR